MLLWNQVKHQVQKVVWRCCLLYASCPYMLLFSRYKCNISSRHLAFQLRYLHFGYNLGSLISQLFDRYNQYVHIYMPFLWFESVRIALSLVEHRHICYHHPRSSMHRIPSSIFWYHREFHLSLLLFDLEYIFYLYLIISTYDQRRALLFTVFLLVY